MRISALVLDGVFDTGFAVTLDAFRVANNLSARLMGGAPRFNVSVVGCVGGFVQGRGWQFPCRP
jgi:hypothetical protein